MRVFEVLFSPTGGTLRVLKSISKAFSCEKIKVDLSKKNYDGKSYKFYPQDLVLVAVPVFSGRAPIGVPNLLRSLNGNGASAVAIAVYGNRAIDDALVELSDVLTECRFRVIAGISAVAEHSIARNIAKNRPDLEDEEELLDFGEKIKEKYSLGDFKKPSLPGNRPYKTASPGLIPFADDNCIKCLACVKACPVGAIFMSNPKKVNTDKCISCMRCISVCPNGARHNDLEKVKAIEEKLLKNCPERNVNTLYLD